MSNPVAELSALLREVGARPTFDRRASIALPCWLCDTTSEPRDLVIVGRYERRIGSLWPGDAMRRPMCAACEQSTAPTSADAATVEGER